MSTLQRQPLSVKPSLVHGLGVFADADIAEGDTIEECYVLTVPKGEALKDYVFNINHDDFKDVSAIPLGFGAIYNHANEPNAAHKLNIETSLLQVFAHKPIKRGEEIFICYGESWFSSRNINVRQLSLKYKIKKLLKRTQVTRRILLVSVAVVLFLHVI